MKKLLAIGMILALTIGCATPQKTGQAMQAVAVTAPTIAYQLDEVYKVLYEAKALPNYQEKVTPYLRALDLIGPYVQAQGAALAGGDFNVASAIIQTAITAARVMGLWM